MASLFVVLFAYLMSIVPTFVLSEPGGMRCYACTSYIEQCKESVRHGDGDVFKTRCNTKCFVRHGEDGATYRGCFDGFVGVPHLNGDFVGCRNMSWPFDKSLRWCLCQDDLCNGASMKQMNHYKSSVNTIENEVIHDYNLPKGQAAKMAKYAKEGKEQQDNLGEFETHYQMEETNHGATLETHAPAASGHSNEGAERPNEQHGYDNSYDAQDAPPRQEYEFRDIYFPPKPSSPDFKAQRADQERQDISHDGSKTGEAFVNGRSSQNEFYQTPDQIMGYSSYNKGARDMYYPHENKGFHNFPPQLSPPYEGYDLDVEEMKPLPFPRELAERIPCGRTGFYQNPDDCRTFVACIRDPRSVIPIMHLMRCPEGLVWDNTEKICKELSSTCNVAVSGNYGGSSQFDVQDNVIDPLASVDSKNRYEEVEMYPSDFYNGNDYNSNGVEEGQEGKENEIDQGLSNNYPTQEETYQQQPNDNNANYQNNFQQPNGYQGSQDAYRGYQGGSDGYHQQQNYQSPPASHQSGYNPQSSGNQQAQPPSQPQQTSDQSNSYQPSSSIGYPNPNSFQAQGNNNKPQKHTFNTFDFQDAFPQHTKHAQNNDQRVTDNRYQSAPNPPPKYATNNYFQPKTNSQDSKPAPFKQHVTDYLPHQKNYQNGNQNDQN